MTTTVDLAGYATEDYVSSAISDVNTTLSGAINSETEARIAADATMVESIETSINTLTTAYQAADEVLSTNITNANDKIDDSVEALTAAYQDADTNITNAYQSADTTLTTNVANAQESADTANVKADAIATFTTEDGEAVSSTNAVTGVALTAAVDASNAKANDEALSQVQDDQENLQEEQEQGTLFIDFFNRLFGSK